MNSILPSLEAAQPASNPGADAYFGNLKSWLKGSAKTPDVSDVTAFQPILAQGKAQGMQLAETAGQGGAALAKTSGVPGAGQIEAADSSIAQAQNKENTGMAVNEAIPGMVAAGTGYESGMSDQENQFTSQQNALEGQAVNSNSQYNPSMWGGMLAGIAGGVGSALGSFI